MRTLRAALWVIGTVIAGCSAGATYPITDGFHKTLPKETARLVGNRIGGQRTIVAKTRLRKLACCGELHL